jgi:hypothetical protein
MNTYGLTPLESRRLRVLGSPVGIQRFLDDLPYHHGNTAWSPRRVLRGHSAHCLEGAIFAAAALRANGYPPLLLDLEAVFDVDHVLAVYRNDGHWGAIGKSNFAGLRFREPVYRSLRELAMSYFDQYYNLRGDRTLRGYSQPINLQRFDRLHWMISEQDVWFIPEYLCHIHHRPLLTATQERRLTRLDARSRAAGLVGYSKEKH